MKLSAWIGLIAVSGCLGLVACSDDGDDNGTGGSDAGTGGSGASGGSAGSGTGGSAGSGTGGSSGSATGGSAGTAGAAGCTKPGEPCGDCIAESCCAEDTACTADADCSAIYNCFVDNCQEPDAGDQQACIATCSTGHEAGATAFGALIACGLTNCSAECQ